MADLTEPAPPPSRERAFNLPGAVLACCLVFLAIHGLRTLLPAPAQLRAAYQHVPQDMIVALMGNGGGRWWSVVTYAFLHGGWLHVGLNCIWLAAFGSPVARRVGAARFLLLLLVAAICGAIVQFLWNMASFVPVVGASAAVAGAMGAATRFVFRPAEEPSLFDRSRLEEADRRPALTLRQTIATRGALFFVVVWFGSNFLFGLYPALGGMGDAPIAWQAHIGGFLAGLLLFSLFDPRHPAPAAGIDAEDSADLPAGSADRGF